MIGWQRFPPSLNNLNFPRYVIGSETSIIVLAFILDYFQENLMTKFFKKSKTPCYGAIFEPFLPNLNENEFSRKKGLCQFLNIQIIIIYQRVKIRKNK